MFKTKIIVLYVGSQTGTLNLLEIPGCKEDERCILRRGTNATVEIDFAISEYDGFPAGNKCFIACGANRNKPKQWATNEAERDTSRFLFLI